MKNTTKVIYDNLFLRYPDLVCNKDQILFAFEILVEAFKHNKKLLICGNGGSASDSEHMVAELLKIIAQRKILKVKGDFRMQFTVFLAYFRQRYAGKVRQRADGYGIRPCAFFPALAQQLLIRSDKLEGVVQVGFACRCQPGSAVCAFKQRKSELLFQYGNLLNQSLTGNKKLFRSACEAAAFMNGFEAF